MAYLLFFVARPHPLEGDPNERGLRQIFPVAKRHNDHRPLEGDPNERGLRQLVIGHRMREID